MTGIAVGKYQPLPSWDSWDQRLNPGSNDLSPIDLRDQPSERAFAHDETQTPVISVKLCFPWGKYEESNLHEDAEAAKQSCWGWVRLGLFGSRRRPTEWVEVSLQGETRQNRKYGRQNVDQGYSKPSAWKRILRKLRADAKQVRIACCEGLCWPREVSDYNTFNYENNFDKGSEHWQQHTSVRVSKRPSRPFADPQKSWKNGSDMSEFSLQVDPIWQRRKPSSPSKLRVKKVTFADV